MQKTGLVIAAVVCSSLAIVSSCMWRADRRVLDCVYVGDWSCDCCNVAQFLQP